jgi:hypothetical protein
MLKITPIQISLALFFTLVVLVFLWYSQQSDRAIVYQKENIECIKLLNNTNHIKAIQIIGVKDSNNPWVLHYASVSNEVIINKITSYMNSKFLIHDRYINFKDKKATYRIKIIKNNKSFCEVPVYLTNKSEGIITISGKDSVYRCNNAVFLIDSIFKKSILTVYNK